MDDILSSARILTYIQNNKKLFIDYIKSINHLEETNNINGLRRSKNITNIKQATYGVLRIPSGERDYDYETEHYRMMCFEYYFRYITEEERIQILNILVFDEKDVDEETEKPQ